MKERIRDGKKSKTHDGVPKGPANRECSMCRSSMGLIPCLTEGKLFLMMSQLCRLFFVQYLFPRFESAQISNSTLMRFH